MKKQKIDTLSIDVKLFQSRFKKRYKEKGFTQETLATAAGISKDTIGKWLRTDSEFYMPSLDTLYKVSQVLDCSIDYFVNPNMDCLTVSNQKIADTIGLSDSAIDTLKKDLKQKLHVIDCINLLLGLADKETVTQMFVNMWLYLHNGKRSFKSVDGKYNDDYMILNTAYPKTKKAVKGCGIGINANNLDGIFLSNITAYLGILKSKS